MVGFPESGSRPYLLLRMPSLSCQELKSWSTFTPHRLGLHASLAMFFGGELPRFTRVPAYCYMTIRAQRPFARKVVTPSSPLYRPHVPVLLPLTNYAFGSPVSLCSLDHPL